MAAFITPETPIPFTIEAFNNELEAAAITPLPDLAQKWRLGNIPDLLSFVSGVPDTTLLYHWVVDQPGINEALRFAPNCTTIPGPGYVFAIKRTGEVEEGQHDLIVLTYGTLLFNSTIYSALHGCRPELDASGNLAPIEENMGIDKINNFSGLEVVRPFCFKCDESTLYKVLEDRQYSQEVRIMTALLCLFPYIEDPLKGHVRVIELQSAQQDRLTIGLGGVDPGRGHLRGRYLTMLSLFVLGPAYTREERLHEQICRRTQAASASKNIEHLNPDQTKDLITGLQWQTADLLPVVSEALSMAVCVTEPGHYNPEAPVGNLMAIEDLINQQLITREAGALLEQARLVYTNYHSTSIHFIQPVLPLLESLVGQQLAFYAAEIARYREIEDVVTNSPYLGLRSVLPERFQIKRMPRLTYTGLLYHKTTLTTSEEKESFALYKTSTIVEHLGPKTEKIFIDSVVELLPPPGISTIALLLRHVDLERSERILASKDSSFRKEVLELLRNTPNPGPWAVEELNKETAEYQATLVQAGSAIIEKTLAAKFETFRSQIDLIPDRELRRARTSALLEWRDQIRNEILGLTPWLVALPPAPRLAQGQIRDQMVANLQRLMEVVQGGFNHNQDDQPRE